MAAGGTKEQFNPVQAQKSFFVFDSVIPDEINGSHFAFAPCHFGPFDKAVYDERCALLRTDKVGIDHARRYPRYSLTETGFRLGKRPYPPRLRAIAEMQRSGSNRLLFNIVEGDLRPLSRYGSKQFAPHLAAASRASPPPRPLHALLSGLALTVDSTGMREEYRQEVQPSAVHDLAAISRDWVPGNDVRYAMEFHIHASEHER